MAAPAFLFLYGIANFMDGLDGTYGPGIFWTLGHIMFLLALITFSVILVMLRQRLRNVSAEWKFIAMLAMIVGLIGLAVFVRVAIIDIITGLSATDHSTMGAISDRLNAYPLASLEPFYDLGPLLFQLGLLELMVQLTVQKPRQLPWWSPALLFGGFLVLGYDSNLLVPGAVLIGIALAPFFWDKMHRDSK